MKKLLYTLICAIFIPALMNAAPVQLNNLGTSKFLSNPKDIQLKETSIMSKAEIIKPKISAETFTNNNITPFLLNTRIDNFASTGMFYGASLIHYLPDAGTVVVPILTSRIRTEDNTDYSRLSIVPFNDDGLTIDTNKIFRVINSTDTLFSWISYGVTNPIEGNKDISKFNYLVHTAGVYPKGSDYNYVGNALLTSNPLNIVNDQASMQIKYADEINPGGGTDYELPLDLYINGFTGDDAAHYYMFYKATRKANSTAKYGPHFSSLADISKTDYEYSQTQTSYDNDFKASEPNGTWSSQTLSDHHDGVIYHAVVNFFVDPNMDIDHRYPAVAKSTDGGYTFTKFERLPTEVLNNFVLSVSPEQYKLNDLSYDFSAYQELDFVVYGADKMSFIGRFYVVSTAESIYLYNSLVEVTKDGSTWSIKPVENMLSAVFNSQLSQYQLSTYSVDYFSVYTNTATNGELLGQKYPVILDNTPREHEVQISKTKDGQYLVAKWLDFNYDPNKPVEGYESYKNYEGSAIKGKPVDYLYQDRDGNYQAAQVDEFLTTNVFVRYRKVTENTWSAPMNITKLDRSYILHSYMPKIIPDIEHIPLLYTEPLIMSPDNLTDYGKEVYAKYLSSDIVAQNMYGLVRNIMYGNFSYTQKSNVEEPIILSEEISVYPNPALNEMNINLVNGSGNANIEIFNMLGEKVMTLSNAAAMTKANISTLGNGMYIIKAKDGGKEYSTTFTIAR